MRVSKLFSQTLREAPAEAEIPSHRLLLRAGFIRQLAAGIFTYMPLAKRSLTKIEDIMRGEMNAIGGQELAMPVVHPAEIWQETGRWYQIGSEMGRFKDKNNRDMVLAMTHEEVVADIVRKEIEMNIPGLKQAITHIVSAQSSNETKAEAVNSHKSLIERLMMASESIGLAGLTRILGNINDNIETWYSEGRLPTDEQKSFLSNWPYYVTTYLHFSL